MRCTQSSNRNHKINMNANRFAYNVCFLFEFCFFFFCKFFIHYCDSLDIISHNFNIYISLLYWFIGYDRWWLDLKIIHYLFLARFYDGSLSWLCIYRSNWIRISIYYIYKSTHNTKKKHKKIKWLFLITNYVRLFRLHLNYFQKKNNFYQHKINFFLLLQQNQINMYEMSKKNSYTQKKLSN